MDFQIDFPAQPRFPILAPAGTVVAPSYAFSAEPGLGLYRAGAGNLTLAYAGGAAMAMKPASSAFDIYADAALIRLGASSDTILVRDGAANTLALRNGTNPQTFRVYNTYTDGSNYERLETFWSSSVAYITTSAAGTGTGRELVVGTQTAGALTLRTSGSNRWQLGGSTGHFLAAADNTYDIGASGATRPRTLYLSANMYAPGGVYIGTTASAMKSSADGVMALYDAAGTSFSRLQFGGTTSSFPAIARDGAGVKIVGADGTSVSWMKVPGVTVANLPAAATAGAGARSFVTDALTPVFGSAVTGGGAVTVPVYSTGSAWNVG